MIFSPTSEGLVDFLLAEAGNDDDLYLRPLKRQNVPDVQPWMVRQQEAYIAHAIERYSAIALFCLSPISFEIVAAESMGDMPLNAARDVTEERGFQLEIAASSQDTNWRGWRSWLRSRFEVHRTASR